MKLRKLGSTKPVPHLPHTLYIAEFTFIAQKGDCSVNLQPLDILCLLLLAWTALYLLCRHLPLKRLGLEINPLYLTYKTGRFNDFLKKTAARNPQFWKVVSNIGIALAVGEMISALYLLGNNLFNFLYAPQRAGPVFPALPGITISLQWFPYFLIAAGLAITAHEVAHGVVASLEGIAVKSAGIFIAPITFGGFVEPVEEEFERSRLVARLRMLSAGSLANLGLGLLVTLIATGLFVPNSGVLVMAVGTDGPAYGAGIRPWEVIYGINGTSIGNLVDLAVFMDRVKPGDFLVVETTSGARGFRTEANPENTSRGVMGVYNLIDYFGLRVEGVSPQFTYQINLALYWISLIMTSLAIFNMLPLFPLDGEAYVHSLLKEKVKKNLKAVRIALNGVCFCLLAFNVALTFLKYGLTPI